MYFVTYMTMVATCIWIFLSTVLFNFLSITVSDITILQITSAIGKFVEGRMCTGKLLDDHFDWIMLKLVVAWFSKRKVRHFIWQNWPYFNIVWHQIIVKYLIQILFNSAEYKHLNCYFSWYKISKLFMEKVIHHWLTIQKWDVCMPSNVISNSWQCSTLFQMYHEIFLLVLNWLTQIRWVLSMLSNHECFHYLLRYILVIYIVS